jgi:hypothetical protein
MKNIITLLFILLNFNIYAQCPNCTPDINVNLPSGGTELNPIQFDNVYGNNANGQIFEFSGNGFYNWSTNNTISLNGIIINDGVNISLGTDNNSNKEAFIIQGNNTVDRGCITIKDGGTLNLSWISKLKYVDICVEDGGTINFDSKNIGNTKNDFTFDNVVINLNGPNASLKFGNSFIDIIDGLDIIGWTGTVSCPSADSPNPDMISSSGNIYWSSDTENICAILNYEVLPVEWDDINIQFDKNLRINKVNWNTLSERDNSHFVIQRSINNINSFIDLGIVEGIGYSDTPTYYNFSDINIPLGSTNLYYRIKQYDFNGDFSYSPVLLSKIQSIESNDIWKVYPNPIVNNNINIQLIDTEIYKGGDIKITLYSNNLVLYDISDIYTLNDKLNTLVQKCGNGILILEITYKDTIEKIKLLKK